MILKYFKLKDSFIKIPYTKHTRNLHIHSSPKRGSWLGQSAININLEDKLGLNFRVFLVGEISFQQSPIKVTSFYF